MALRESKVSRGRARAEQAQASNGSIRLSAARQRLLLQVAHPANVGKSVSNICKQAGCSRDTYYEAMRDAAFKTAREKAVGEHLGDAIGPAIKALRESATIRGPAGSRDRVTLFKMAGLFPKQAEVFDATHVEGDMPNEEALWYYIETNLPKAHWLPAIRMLFDEGKLKPRKPANLAERELI